jgi:DNA-directed RNA polymerase specialized sigma24 family protein
MLEPPGPPNTEVQRWIEGLNARLRGIVPNRDWRQDVISETVLLGLRNWSKIEQRTERERDAWLLKVATHRHLDSMRGKKNAPTLSLDTRLNLESERNDYSLIDERDALGKQVNALVGDWLTHEKVIFFSRFVDDQSVEEIAQSLGMHPSGVKAVLSRIKKRLQRRNL